MRYVLGIFITLMFIGCVTERKRQKICNTCPSKINTITKDSIVYRDSTIRIPGETITDTLRIECDENNKPVLKDRQGNTLNKRKVKGEKGNMTTTLLDSGIIANTCDIDSASVAFRWNETHRTTEKESVITQNQNSYIWLLSIIVGFVLGFIAGRFREK